MSSAATATPKKKPGRPRKNVGRSAPPALGIVSAPKNAGNCLELSYSSPATIKHIIDIFGSYGSSEIAFEFHRDRVEMVGIDHSMRIHIRCSINAADMDVYYLGVEPFRVVVRHDNLKVATSCIEKVHTMMTFSIRREEIGVLYISINNDDYASEDSYVVEVVPGAIDRGQVDNYTQEVLNSYPIEFTIDAHHLRSRFKSMKSISDIIMIRKDGGSPLSMTLGENSRVVYTSTYTSGDKINLRSNIAEDEHFMSAVSIKQIWPLMSVNMPEKVTIFADNDRAMAFYVGFDYRSGPGASGGAGAPSAPAAPTAPAAQAAPAAPAAQAAATTAPLSSFTPHNAINVRLFIISDRLGQKLEDDAQGDGAATDAADD